MFVTKIGRLFRLLTGEMIDALSVEPRAHIFKKKSLTAMVILMELDGGACYWPATRQVGEDDEVEEKANEGAGGSSEMYRNMSRGDWQGFQGQWMDQQDRRWGQLDTWTWRHEECTNWMYDHIIRHFQYLSTHDNLDPHLRIDPFPEGKADYPPYGYTRHAPLGYDYRYGPALDGSN
ncbi:hypothetical protein Tco_0444811 [Tanacetum coccineum]